MLSPISIKRLLIPLDGSTLAEQALSVGAELARRHGAELGLVFVHEPEPYAGYPDAPWQGARRGMERPYLADTAARLRRDFDIVVSTHHPTGHAAPAIVSTARAFHANLIVMTTHGRTGVARALVGSVADQVLRTAAMPVLLHESTTTRHAPPTAWDPARVLIALDGSPRAEAIVGAATAVGGQQATYLLARVVLPVPIVISTVDAYTLVPSIADPDATERAAADARAYLAKMMARLPERGLARIEKTVLVSDRAGATLLDVVRREHPDLIALASHGRGASRFVLGSMADELLRGCRVPLLVCRPPTLDQGAVPADASPSNMAIDAEGHQR